jgi:hypothetical protein
MEPSTPKDPALEKEKAAIARDRAVVYKIGERRDRLSERYPLVFTLTGAFGLVATFYGFEGIIDRIDALANNPYFILGTGILALVITGQLYKKLS